LVPAPRRIAVDREGFVYVANELGQVRRFSPSGTVVSQFNRTDASSQDAAQTPIEGLAADDPRRVYVAVAGKIVVFDGTTGRLVQEIASKQASDCYRVVVPLLSGNLLVQASCSDQGFRLVEMAPTGEVLGPRGLATLAWSQDPKIRFAVDAQGNTFVHERLAGTISVTSPRGVEVCEIPLSGGYPSAMVVIGDNLVVGAAGEVYVLSLQGKPKGKLPLDHVGAIHDIAAAPDGQVWVASDRIVGRYNIQSLATQ
jgi:streptogramin lyase